MDNYIRLRSGEKFNFGKQMKFMGIVNVTDNSFYDGSRTPSTLAAFDMAKKHIKEGAQMIDVGGESTRPNSEPISEENEIARVVPVIEMIKREYPEVIVSVDTYRSKTAMAAIQAGADLINDISAMSFDDEMVDVVADIKTPIVLMHTKGRPKDMQNNPSYYSVVDEVMSFFENQIDLAYSKGIKKDKLILDLGIGFGKNYTHNIELLKNIDIFLNLGFPHLLAVSRKTFIGECLGKPTPTDRLYGTLAISAYACQKGVEMARVHDVKENLEVVRMLEVLV